MGHDGRIAGVGRRVDELERSIGWCLEIIGGRELAGVLVEQKKARVGIGEIELAARRQDGCDGPRPAPEVR